MAIPAHWMDDVVDEVIETGDPAAIAQAIANSPKVIDAIKAGLAEIADNAKMPPDPRRIGGLTPAQLVRRRVVDAISSPS